jgi:hypothetical protein
MSENRFTEDVAKAWTDLDVANKALAKFYDEHRTPWGALRAGVSGEFFAATERELTCVRDEAVTRHQRALQLYGDEQKQLDWTSGRGLIPASAR